jgi:alcohol dehydrogenase class IV
MNSSNASVVEHLQFTGNRLLMRGMKLALGILPLREPKLLVGTSALDDLADNIAARSLQKVLIVTTAGIVRRGQSDEFVRALELRGVTPVIYDGIQPDPTFAIVNEGLDLLKRERCDAVVAFGGGSAMDAAKVMAVAATNRRSPEKLVGILKGLRKPLPFFAVPTTAGTGSETTVASVISDDDSHAKAFVVDHRTLALAAAFDPRLMQGIGPDLTAATGMDALTHAIEAWVSTISTPETDRYALESIQLILEYLPRACDNGSDLEAREAMAIASYKAGRAFTQALVGYVHAISHQLGAYYGIPHGLGNAVVLPKVLAFSQGPAQSRLAQLAVNTGLGEAGDSEADLAQSFVDHIVELNRRLGIPETVIELRDADIPAIARGATREALLNYAVPRHMTRQDCEQLLHSLQGQSTTEESLELQVELKQAA